MLGSKEHWRFAVCVVSVPLFVLAGGCSSGGSSSGSSGQGPTSQQGARGGPVTNAATGAPSPGKVTSGILTMISNYDNRTYGFLDPNSGHYSEAVTFKIPNTPGTSAGELGASPDLTKFPVTSMVNGQSMAGWIDPSGQFTAVTTSTTTGAFGGNPPVYSAVGFDGAGNFYYKKNAQGASTELYEVSAGSTGNARKVEVTPPNAVDDGVALNSDGSLMWGCEMVGNWLDANTWVLAVAPGTQIAKIPITGRRKGGCPILGNQVPLLPASNTATVHDPVASPDGTKLAFFYDDPDRVNHNFPTVYTVGTDGKSQPTLVNLSESDAKKLAFAKMLKWS